MSHFQLSRRAHIAAPPERIVPLLEDFREWQKWSPWEGVDPQLRRTYSGAERGVGARYAWSGNRQAGEGTMEVLASGPQGVDVDLRFLKPFKATNLTRFVLTPSGSGTDIEWVMSGERNAVMGVMGKLFFDKAIAKDFDKGLAGLKAAAEAS